MIAGSSSPRLLTASRSGRLSAGVPGVGWLHREVPLYLGARDTGLS